MTETANAMTPSARLRAAVWDGHQRAEHHPLMRHLLSKFVGRPVYVAYLEALLPLYRTLEAGLDAQHPLTGLFTAPELARAGRIAADIDSLTGGKSATAGLDLPPLPSAVAKQQPVAMAAMAYIRYFGDLAGGQAMGRHLTRQLGISPGSGGQFYQFELPGGDSSQGYLDRLRVSLDHAMADEPTATAFMNAAINDFEWHLSTFDKLWAIYGKDGT